MDDTLNLLNKKASKLATVTNTHKKDLKELIFKYNGIDYILHLYESNWRVSYPYKDMYWFDYIEDNPIVDLSELINSDVL